MENVDKDFGALIYDMFKAMGFDPALGTIFGILYLEPGEISLTELAKKTGYSSASVSSKTVQLEAMGYITRKRKPSTRKVFLYAEKDLFKIIREHGLRTQEQKMEIAKTRLPGIIKRCRQKGKSKRDMEKLKILENYKKQMLRGEKFFKLMKAILGRI